MKEYARKNLNISRLLELGVLDIRAMAANNAALTADEYFSRVERFIADAPRLIDALDTAEASDSLETMLKQIGCDKPADALNRMREGSASVNETRSALIALADKLGSTYTPSRFANTDAAYGDVLLSEALTYLDHEEANRKARILVVDDVTIVLNTITSVLSPYYEVFALKNSSQIENFLARVTPDLFILDIQMHEISGFDLVPIIRRFDEHRHTPIIFLTGNASMDNLKDAIALGACDFITKPVDRHVLLEKIEKNIVRRTTDA